MRQETQGTQFNAFIVKFDGLFIKLFFTVTLIVFNVTFKYCVTSFIGFNPI